MPGAPLVRNAAGRLFGGVLAAVLLAGAVCVPAAPAQTSVDRASRRTAVLEAGLLLRVNALRRSHGLAPLRPSSELRQAALTHSAAMGNRGFFGHDSFGGGRFWQRLRPHYPRRGGDALWSVGENLLWATPRVDAGLALRMWLASPTHRRTLLRQRWREIGLAAVHVRSAPGFFGGREVTIVTADFGVRR